MAKKIGILIENRFIEKEIFYYKSFFETEGFEVVFLTRLWGQSQLTFKGLEWQAELTTSHSFENMRDTDLSDYVAIIVPAGYVSDYLLYTEKPGETSPAAAFIKRIIGNKAIIKGFICHSLWIAGPIKEVFAGRNVTCHNNIVSHVTNAGITYCDKDVCVDGDLVTARTGGHHGVFAKEILVQVRKGEK